jgi:hypothetical protein
VPEVRIGLDNVAGRTGSAGSGSTPGTGAGAGGSGGGAGSAGAAGSGASPDAGITFVSGSIGQPCTSGADCAGTLLCASATSNAEFKTGGPQGGYCTAPCRTNTDCSLRDDTSACSTSLGLCIGLCTLGTDTLKCGTDRALACVAIGVDTVGACLPYCTSNAACGAGRFCNLGTGLCVDQAPVGGGLGTPCTAATVATDCAGGLCLEFATQTSPTGVVGFCSGYCTYGRANGCGFDAASGGVRQAYCLQPQAADGQYGDLGYCWLVCDTTNDCTQLGTGWVCNLFTDATTVSTVGRLGQCLPPPP